MRLTIFILAIFMLSCEDEIILPEVDNTFIDVRDGKEYEFLKIGKQTWMIENLAYYDPDYVDTINFKILKEKPTIPLYYHNDRYGVLYNWLAAVEAVPYGWHIPSNDEWSELIEYTSGYLALYDFRPLYGGCRNDEFYTAEGESSNWWGGDDELHYVYRLSFYDGDIKLRDSDRGWDRCVSVRCVKD